MRCIARVAVSRWRYPQAQALPNPHFEPAARQTCPGRDRRASETVPQSEYKIGAQDVSSSTFFQVPDLSKNRPGRRKRLSSSADRPSVGRRTDAAAVADEISSELGRAT